MLCAGAGALSRQICLLIGERIGPSVRLKDFEGS